MFIFVYCPLQDSNYVVKSIDSIQSFSSPPELVDALISEVAEEHALDVGNILEKEAPRAIDQSLVIVVRQKINIYIYIYADVTRQPDNLSLANRS